MSKESVSALIKAIQATTDLFVSKGLTRRQQLVSKTSDDSYVQELEDVYSSGIDTIVENIPDDPEPPGPTPTDKLLLYFATGTRVVAQGYVTNTSAPEVKYQYPMYTSDTVQDSTTLFTPESGKVYKAGQINSSTQDVDAYSDLYPRYVDTIQEMPSELETDPSETTQLFMMLGNGQLFLGWNYYNGTLTNTDKTDQWFKVENSSQPQSEYIDVILGFILNASKNIPPSVSNMRAVTFDTNDYWFGYILNSTDVYRIANFGLTYNENYIIDWNNSFRFEPLDLYTDDGQTSAGFDMSNFYCGGSNSTPSRLCIKNYTATSTNTLTWKCRITKREVVPYIEVLFGLRYQDGVGWQSKTFSANDYWYAGILSETDRQDLEAFGCTFVNSEADHKQGPIGTINGNDPNFTFEPMALYSDLEGQNENVADMSNFYCAYESGPNRLFIRNHDAYDIGSVVWKCRITRVV